MHTKLLSESLRGRDYFRVVDVDNIEMDLKEIVCEFVDWVNLVQDRVQ
jgi:hypothetical protein